MKITLGDIYVMTPNCVQATTTNLHYKIFPFSLFKNYAISINKM